MISIIVPAFNAGKTIRQCIESVLKESEDFEEESELIVVDDESSDDTRQIAKKYKEVLLVEQKHAGPAVARNLGAKKARGEIIIFTDSDCEVAENWLREMIAPFKDKNVVGVQGAYKTEQASLVARFEQIDIELRYERMKKAKHLDWIGSYSAAYRKNVFFDFGGFDESFPIASGEDPDLSYRIAEKGLKLFFNPKAIVFHQHPGKLKKYLKTKFFRAYWRVLLYKKHPKKAMNDSYTTLGLKIRIASIIWLFAGIIFQPVFLLLGWKSWLFLLIGAIIFIAGCMKFFVFSLKKDWKIALVSPIILFINSTVFLLGLLTGLIGRVGK